MSRSIEHDVSPYPAHRTKPPTSGYNSDSGRAPLVSPLRGLTTPDLFVPLSNQIDDIDDMHGNSPTSNDMIMYATTTYRSQLAEELSVVKNDRLKVLQKESHLRWYVENMTTGKRGYISPNRLHINRRDNSIPARSTTKTNDDTDSISDIPRLNNKNKRQQIPQKSVTFNDSD
jgi:hypothetical protein